MNRAEELKALAENYIEKGDCQEALEYSRRALMIQERAVGQDSLALAPFVFDLALVHAALDHDGECRNLLGRLLRLVPSTHPLVHEVGLAVSELDAARSAA